MLIDLTVTGFLNKVSGSDPVPGGGSVSALCGAVASSLAAMVAALTIGKKGYEDKMVQMSNILSSALKLRAGFLTYIDKDSDAFNKLFACYKLPKGTDEEKAARSVAIQKAVKEAATVPMMVARDAVDMMDLIAQVAENGNSNAITDACVAMMNARSAVLGALLNVRINLGSVKDKVFAGDMQREADEIEAKAREKETKLLNKVNKDLRV